MTEPIRTMEELARWIGVSRPTLSRFFHDPASVRGSTREKIEAGLAAVDYVPNFFATHMNRAETRLIGVVVPHLADVFQMNLVAALETDAAARGFRILLQDARNDGGREAEAVLRLRGMNVDGIVISPCGADSRIEALARQAALVPMVMIDAQVAGSEGVIDFVGNDNAQSIGLIVDYLLRKGLQPAFLGMPPVNRNAEERRAAYLAAMAAAGMAPDLVPQDAGPVWSFEAHGFETMGRLFAAGAYAGATLLCASDRIATGALKAAQDYGLMAHGFRIAGHDDDPLTRYLHPGLTTVAQDVTGIAARALDLLLARAAGETRPAQSLRLPARLVIRQSA